MAATMVLTLGASGIPEVLPTAVSGSPIEAAAQLLLKTSRPAPDAGGAQALGWEVIPAREGRYIAKDCVTTSQCATVAFDPDARRSVIALSNTAPLLRGTGPSEDACT